MFLSSALEVLEDVADPDVVVVSCGGGGFVSGISAAISLSGLKNCRLYAVEPDGGNFVKKFSFVLIVFILDEMNIIILLLFMWILCS